jgi:short-subunit dehydrogenase
MPHFRSALITGASSGVAQALAFALAAPGITLHLSGHDPARLDAVAVAYCASKAAVDTWIVGSAYAERRHGIRQTGVCQGYVRSGMTAGNRFPMPGLMDAEHAAGIIQRGVAAGRVRVAFPCWMALAARMAGLLPQRLRGAVTGDRAQSD